mgnify:CR=1 FL=1
MNRPLSYFPPACEPSSFLFPTSWKIDFLLAVARSLERAGALARGLGYDYETLRGPSGFAREIVKVSISLVLAELLISET